MKEYDVLVIGSGAGIGVASDALSSGVKVAVVDRGPLGGTCLNLGCIPSKLLIASADRVAEIESSKKLGVEAEITNINFKEIMERMRTIITKDREGMREGIKHAENLDFYEGTGHFVDDYTLEIDGKKIKGKKIFIAAGARPLIPSVKGIESIDYLTNESILELNKLPKSVVILGGGYISCEFGHFLAGMGSKVTIVQRNQRLVANEEPEISDLLLNEMSKRMTIHTDTEVIEVLKEGDLVKVIGKNKKTGENLEITAERILVASGRQPNSDILKIENTGVETDARGFIKANEYLETSKENIWAFGDVIGKSMFRHSANKEAAYAWHNSIHEKKVPMKYNAVPHAVFSYPEIASVGMKESEAKKNHDILIGFSRYNDVAKGTAMHEEESFAKAIIDKETNKVLGFHIIGPFASILIQEVINVMEYDLDIRAFFKGIRIHPALTELISSTFGNLMDTED